MSQPSPKDTPEVDASAADASAADTPEADASAADASAPARCPMGEGDPGRDAASPDDDHSPKRDAASPDDDDHSPKRDAASPDDDPLIGCPVMGRTRPRRDDPQASIADPRVLADEELTYNDYLRVSELIALQSPRSDPEHGDEMLFIVIHQAYEVWFRLILHELEATIAHLRDGDTLRAHHLMRRCARVMALLVDQIHLLETMTPVDFLGFRDVLKPASGFQSVQFREIEFLVGLKDRRYLRFFERRPDVLARLEARLAGPDLRLELFAHLGRQGLALPPSCRLDALGDDEPSRVCILAALEQIYCDPHNPDTHNLYLLLEACVDFDAQLGLWREHHVRVVERIIGRKPGTGGSSGVDYLERNAKRRVFPYLWEVRTHLTGCGPTEKQAPQDGASPTDA